MTMIATDIIRVAIVDDHSLIREGLRSFLSGPDLMVVGEATCGEEAIEVARTLRPDVMLLDIRMRNGDGLECLPRIRAASPRTGVVILTTYANPSYLARAIQGGAAGFISKETEPEEIERAIRAVARGERTQFQPARPLAGVPGPDDEDTVSESLSNREREVLRLLVQGLSNSEIAERLHISLTTTKTHIHHILDKLHVEDRTQAVLWAVRNGLID